MTKREENKLSMYKAVLKFFDDNVAKLERIPVIASIIEGYRGLVGEVESKHEEHQTAAKGFADHKGDRKVDLVEELVTIGDILFAYAARINDQRLKALFKVTPSGLKEMRDTELLNRARTMHDRAEEHLTDLEEFTIDEAVLQVLQERIDAYEEALTGREAAAGTQTAARVALTDRFSAVDDILYDQLDPLMEVFRTEDRDFYNEYKSVRVIKDI